MSFIFRNIRTYVVTSFLIIACFTLGYSQITVYNDGLATLHIESGLTVTIEGGYTAQNNVSDGQIDNDGTLRLQGDWTNNNSTNNAFSTGSGTVEMVGTTSQSIGGSLTTTFYNLTLNNTTADNSILLNIPIAVDNVLTLTDGEMVTSSTNILTMNSSGSFNLNGTPQDNSYIEGPLINVVATDAVTSKEFPIGKGNIFRQVDLIIDQNVPTSTNYTAEVINSTSPNLNLTGGIEKVSSVRYYTITQSPATALDGVQIRIYYGSDDGVADPPTLTVAKESGTDWVDLTGTASGAPTGNILSGSFTSFSDFALASTSTLNPLPVELSYFDVKLVDHIVSITWMTSSETDNDFFTIERSSDGFYFEELGRVDGAGNSKNPIEYEFKDLQPFNGLSYYRLKQTDFDGQFEYFRTKSIEVPYSNDLTIYPNPLRDNLLFFKLPWDMEQDIDITIFNSIGISVYSRSLQNPANSFMLELPGNLESGVYYLIGTSSLGCFNKKFIVQK